jgi:hypothetical protein
MEENKMKKLIVIVALAVGIYYFVAPQTGLSGLSGGSGPESAAVSTYQKFANAYVINDYATAARMASGPAADMLMERIESPAKGMFKGTLERARFNVISSDISSDGNRVDITATQSAAVSMGGSTANPNSPGAYVTHEQTATLEKSGSDWVVMEFTDKVIPK